MNVVGLITVREHSERLPKKALEDINGKPLLQHTIDMLLLSGVDRVVVATTSGSPNIIHYCEIHNIECEYENTEEDDILGRMCAAVREDCHIVRVWGDNPFPFPWLVNKAIEEAEKQPDSYIVAHSSDSYCSVISSRMLKKLNPMIEDPKYREDIHSWMTENLPSVILNFPLGIGKLTIDTPEDLERMRVVCE